MPDNIMFKRRFTTDGVSPYDEIKWEKFDAVIKDFKTGEIVFEQKDVEFPLSYSQQAVNIITSKYFRGVIGTKKREKSYKQLIKRVVDTNVKWGEEQGYFVSEGSKQIFEDELTHILLNQKAYFNSPVWFNMGWEHREQTASACFIV
ncbi:MAG TPA: vitamin B12-dependent ribonucleotide reductase, partial [Bacillota bacterium]|nr:vitamin B12-dependent ribonucleotide reductase [Bacillota bacterium]